MSRVRDQQRDALVLDCWLDGEPERAIAARVGLSQRAVRLAVERGLGAVDGERLGALFADAYERNVRGRGDDERAAVRVRRLSKVLLARQAVEDPEGAVDAEAPRRVGDLAGASRHPRDVALALAREKAATLVAKGEQVGEVTLDGSREYGGREVAWRFSFSVT